MGLLLDALADLPAAWENVKAAFPMGTTIFYYITLLGAIYFGGLLFWWSIPPSVKWVKYRLNDGPNVGHMVPLGNAHESGAWDWPTERKERYANYLDDPQHLIAVTAKANRSKGAKGPDRWKPENRIYWCRYAVDWITIRSTWDLTVTEAEHTALGEMLNTCANPPVLMTSEGRRTGATPGATRHSRTASDGGA